MTALKSPPGATSTRKAARKAARKTTAKAIKLKLRRKATAKAMKIKALRKPARKAKRVVMRKVGGSLMAAVPVDVVKDMGLAEGQTLSVAYDGARLILEPEAAQAPARYTLREILASCNFDLPKTAEELEWEAAPRVGREAL